MNEYDEVIQAEEAKQLLEHPLFIKAFSSVKDGLVSSLSNSGLGDVDTHHNLSIALQLLEQLKRQLEEYVMTGELVAIQTHESNLHKFKRVVGF